jgi:hypothetical protein
MPIVPGNEPQRTPNSGGSRLGWIIPLVIFGPSLYRFVRSGIGARLTDQQMLIVGGGLVGLVVLAVIVQRVNRSRNDTTSRLPTSYMPAATGRSNTSVPRLPTAEWKVPPAPKYEPMITGKVMLAGVVLAAVMGGLGLLLLV